MRSFRNKTKKKNGGSVAIKILGALKKTVLRSLPTLFCLVFLGLLLGGVGAYAVNAAPFRLTEVRVLNSGTLTQAQAFKFCELKPDENLVTLDLLNVQEVIKRQHPELKEVRVRRVLPNRIDILLKRRTPMVQAMFSRYVQIDKDLIILPGSSAIPFKNLTIIEGALPPLEGVRIGASLKDPATIKAVKLADIVKRSGILTKHQLTKVSLSDKKNMTLVIDNAIEVRMGDNHLIERLKILDQTLKTIGLDPSKTRYIDLRFDDVILGPR